MISGDQVPQPNYSSIASKLGVGLSRQKLSDRSLTKRRAGIVADRGCLIANNGNWRAILPDGPTY